LLQTVADAVKWRFRQKIATRQSASTGYRGRRNALEGSTSGDQLDDQDHNGDDQENVDQSAGDVEAEAEDPQNQQDYKNRPKHACSPCVVGTSPTAGEAARVCVDWMQIMRRDQSAGEVFAQGTKTGGRMAMLTLAVLVAKAVTTREAG
jgi:hypothetical protein